MKERFTPKTLKLKVIQWEKRKQATAERYGWNSVNAREMDKSIEHYLKRFVVATEGTGYDGW